MSSSDGSFFPEQGCSSSGQHNTGTMPQTLAATLCNNIFEAFLLLYPEEIGNYPKVFQHHRMTLGSSTSMTIHVHKAAVSSLFRHSQHEVRAIMKKCLQYSGERWKKRITFATQTEHWHCHFVCISQRFIPLPVAWPVRLH